jgi:hypothetical protein
MNKQWVPATVAEVTDSFLVSKSDVVACSHTLAPGQTTPAKRNGMPELRGDNFGRLEGPMNDAGLFAADENACGRSEARAALTERQPWRPIVAAMRDDIRADDGSDWKLPMPNHELKLAAVQTDITSDEPAVQSEPKQDLKQFGDFSLGEVAVAAVSRLGSNYSKAAEIEFRRREVVIQIEAVEAQKAAVEAQKAAVEAQKAVAEAQKAATLPLRLAGWGTIALAAATFILALLIACDGPLAAACSRLGQLLAG